jgi:MoaA/NifB/PqqE/SkfB family radical SAM enzyme
VSFLKKKYHPVDSSVVREYSISRGRIGAKPICVAPFKSLRFSQTGNVLACCYNRGYILGTYPHHSIKEIWTGEKITSLRKHLSHNDLNLGCDECRQRIENSLFSLAGSRQYDYLSEWNVKNMPGMLDFEISNICNLECVMCQGENSSSVRKEREKLPPFKQVYDENFVKQLEDFIPFIKEARFSGGEPFLVPLYYSIWDMIINQNPKARISIITNATVLNDRIKHLLNSGNFQISVSMDSLKKNLYERIRKNAVFENVMENFEFFYNYSAEKKTGFYLNVCPLRLNWQEIPDIVSYCNERNIHLVFHTVVFPPSESLWALNSIKLQEVFSYLSKADFKFISEIGNENIQTYRQFVEQVKTWSSVAETREQMKKKYAEKSEKELVEILNNHLLEYPRNLSDILQTLLITSGFVEKERKAILLNLLGISPYRISSELMHNESVKLVQRLKMLNYEES